MEDLKHRRSSMVLTLRDDEGTPLKNVTVKARETKSDFLFGCGAFDFIALATKGEVTSESHDHPEVNMPLIEKLTSEWLELFNYGTLPFYLGNFEPKEGQPETESRMAAAKYLRERNITLKGHPLCWHTAWADWLMDYDDATVLDKALKRIDREVSAFKGVIDMWDVINEVVIMPIFNKYDNAITRLCKKYGRIRLLKEVFECARSANPDATLLLNDFDLTESYDILIDGALSAGVPIDVIGIQTHQHQGYRGDAYFEDVLERFSFFGKPLHFTENTLTSGAIMPAHIVDLNDYHVTEWPSTPEFEERQKNEMEHFFRMLFAHPSVQAITNWEFKDGGWLKAPSGMVAADGTPKPVYHMLKNLIKNEWMTNTEFVTDENGVFTLEGFKGEYELSYNGKTEKVTLK